MVIFGESNIIKTLVLVDRHTQLPPKHTITVQENRDARYRTPTRADQVSCAHSVDTTAARSAERAVLREGFEAFQ